MAKLQKGVNDLKTWCLNNGDFGLQLMKEWTGDCDDGKHYEIDEIARSSGRKFKWRCSEGHEWYATVGHRIIGRCCSYCSGKRVSDMNSLKTWCLNNGDFGNRLMQEWTGECEDGKHYEIDGVSFGSQKKFKWKCSAGHEWVASINRRTNRKSGCVYCANAVRSYKVSKARLIQGANDLKTWCLENDDFGQQLLNEWTGECDDGKHYVIDEVSFGSAKKFKWRCSKGHEWVAAISVRTNKKSNCPYCAGKLVSDVNNLKDWCLNNGDFGQQLLNEWTGECDDGKYYEIDEVARATPKRVKWKCSEGHEWVTGINNRTAYRTGCPYCTGKLISDVNNLKDWCLNNGDFGQQLMDEWTGTCDDEKYYDICDVSFGSKKKFLWRCDKGHEWFANINCRTNVGKRGCPYCSGRRVSDKNNLRTWCINNGGFGQQLMKEWTGDCDDGKHYEIDTVARTSNKKFKWKCSEGHEWWTLTSVRTGHKSNCPYCYGNIVSDKNNLKDWCLNNGELGARLGTEWTGICANGNHYAIDEISFGSNKKFKWRCDKGHEWYAIVNNRTKGTGCPHCNYYSTSYPEQFIYWSLKQLYPNTENRCRVLKSQQNPHGIEFDIGIPDIPLCIEYSPTYWHGENQEHDNYKKELCEKANVHLIQIIEDSYDELEHTISDNYICFKKNKSKQDETLVCIVDHILKSIGHSISEIDIGLAKQNAWEYSKGKVEYEKSLEFNYPELAKEWHQTLNNGLKPADLTSGSGVNSYWQCTKCNYGYRGEWCVTVSQRANLKSGCPRCGHNWYKSQQGLPQKYKGKYSYLNDHQTP